MSETSEEIMKKLIRGQIEIDESSLDCLQNKIDSEEAILAHDKVLAQDLENRLEVLRNFLIDGSLGKADWIYDNELKCHIPSCIELVFVRNGVHYPIGNKCGNGPLTGDEIISGRCREHKEAECN